MADNEISEEGRRARFERWEQLGLDQVKHDLMNGGHRVVGGSPQVRALAWDWVRIKEAQRLGIDVSPGAARTLDPDPAKAAMILKAIGATRVSTVEEDLRSMLARLTAAASERSEVDTSASQGEPQMPPPMSLERRRHILAATLVLKALGHAGFDRMLLELGAPEDVGTGQGLAARANSLARYILSNPDAKAVDGSLIGEAVIKRARTLFDRGVVGSSPNVTSHERAEYEDALQSDVRDQDQGHRASQEPEAAAGTSPTLATPRANLLPAIPPGATRKKPRRKVFIVHGREPGPREAVARLLERLDFEPVILHERPNRGRTIITKFQEEAADVGFAIVLMTPDDVGGNLATGQNPRARQNVIFELGFFIGVLGPERVAALVKGDVERPSDFDGVVYIALDDHEAWKLAVARELGAAGFQVDLNKLRPS